MLKVNYLKKADFNRITKQVMEELVYKRRFGGNDSLLLFEPLGHIYALGRLTTDRPKQELFKKENDVECVEVDRGGHITYHGPGQLIGYLIIDINSLGLNRKEFENKIEDCLYQVCRSIGVKECYLKKEREYDPRPGIERKIKQTAVWFKENGVEKKIAAVGLKYVPYEQKLISKHGFALNINTELEYFDNIYPCGYKNKGTTSLKEIIGKYINVDYVAKLVENEFLREFYKHN